MIVVACEFDEFIEMYKDIKLPFWMQTRIETLTAPRLKALEEVNCNRISVGLEHGDEEFRRTIIGKGFSNQRLMDTFKLLNQPHVGVAFFGDGASNNGAFHEGLNMASIWWWLERP